MSETPEQTAADKKREADKRRKQKSRAGKPRPLEVALSLTQREQLAANCETRGGLSGPYEFSEYIATLIRRDAEALAQQLAALGQCDYCQQPLPVGCGGTHRGDGDCAQLAAERTLAL